MLWWHKGATVMGAELPKDIEREVVGRRAELQLLLGAIRRGKAVLLVGLPGVSKTTMLRALARHLGTEPDRFVDVTGDEQLTAHSLVGTFDPPMVLRNGFRPEYFTPGPLTRAMTAGGILYVEEINRAPSGALNVLMTALSEGYLEVPRLGRVEARPGFTVVGALNPLDDVGTARLSRGLADRFIVLELDYQPREEELEIVRRRCGTAMLGLHPFAVDVARESRRHPDLRHGASIRGAIDFVDLVSSYDPEDLDAATLRFLACSAYAGKLRLRPTVSRSACEIVQELMETVLRRDYQGRVEVLLERLAAAPAGEPAELEGEGASAAGEHGDVASPSGGRRRAEAKRRPDEVPGLARPGGGGEAGESRSVPMVDRDRPSAGGSRPVDLRGALEHHLRDLDEVLRRAREHVLRVSAGRPQLSGAESAGPVVSVPWSETATGTLDVEATVEAVAMAAGHVSQEDLRLLTRQRQIRNYVILVDHSGSMVGRKLELGATMAAVLAHLTAAGRADYAVVAFDEELQEIKRLGEGCDLEEVVDRILRLPAGRATDLGQALQAATQLSEQVPEATDVILISDCMPTKGVTTFPGLRALAARVPSLYVCFTDERSAAIRVFNGRRQMDLYQWWARQWVGEERFQEVGEVEEVEGLIDRLSSGARGQGL
jgi:MoxR-like ATPase/Mg-chelatase subunit ChlD